MAILPIVPIAPVVAGAGGSVQPGNRTAALAGGAGGSGAGSFASVLSNQLDAVSSAQLRADDLALKAATGDLASIQDYTIAATEAQLLTQLTVSVRNRALEAFNDIMRMQV